MSRLSSASNKLIVRALGEMLVRVCCAIVLLSCGDEAAAGPLMDAGAPPHTITQPAAAPRPPTTSLAGAAPTPPALPPLACGPTECTRPKNIAADLLMSVTGLPMTGAETVACCLDEQQGVCSSAAAVGTRCDTVAVSDERCPGVDLSALADLVGGLVDSTREAMIGCCTQGACGLDGKIFGRGCVENAEAKRMLSVVPVIGPLINVPPPRACDVGELDNDAGA
jgi:hypothetical protein